MTLLAWFLGIVTGTVATMLWVNRRARALDRESIEVLGV